MQDTAIQTAYDCFRTALPDGIVTGKDAGFALVPRNRTDIPRILEAATVLAQEGKLPAPLQAISANHNGGYHVPGRAIPLDLHRLTMLHIDEKTGRARIEPGVTQGDLHARLEETGRRWLTPKTGAGPRASVLGNALEHGIGIIRPCDHFAAVAAMTVYPAKGGEMRFPVRKDEIRLQAMRASICEGEAKLYADLMSVIAHSHYRGAGSVVAEIEMDLASRPENFIYLKFGVRRDEDATEVIRIVHRHMDMNDIFGEGGFCLVNRARQLAAIQRFPEDLSHNLPLPAGRLDQAAPDLPAWSGIITVGVPTCFKTVFGEYVRQLKKDLTPYCHDYRAEFYEEAPRGLREKLRSAFNHHVMAPACRAKQMDPARLGRPDESDLETAYWKFHGDRKGPGADPVRDGCGVRWGKFVGPDIRAGEMAEIIRHTYPSYGFDPLMTLLRTAPGQTHCAALMTYRNGNKEMAERSKACWISVQQQAARIDYRPHGISYDLQKIYHGQNGYLDQLDISSHPLSPFLAASIPYALTENHVIMLPWQQIVRENITRKAVELMDPHRILMPRGPLV